MYTSGARKRKYSRLQVGSFTSLQKSNREKAVNDCNKIKIQNMELVASEEKIKKKKNKRRKVETPGSKGNGNVETAVLKYFIGYNNF